VGYGIPLSTCDVRAPYVLIRAPYVHESNTHCLRDSFFKISVSLVLRATHVISTLSVRGPCVARADSVRFQFKCPKNAHTFTEQERALHVVCTDLSSI